MFRFFVQGALALCLVGLCMAQPTRHVIWVDDTHDDFDGSFAAMYLMALHNQVDPVTGDRIRFGMWIVEPSNSGNHRCPHPDAPAYLNCPQTFGNDYTSAGQRLAEEVLARAGITDVPVYKSSNFPMNSTSGYLPVDLQQDQLAARELARYVYDHCTPANKCFIASGHRAATVVSAAALYGCDTCEFPGMEDRIELSLLSMSHDNGQYGRHGKNFVEDQCGWGAAFSNFSFPVYHVPTRRNGSSCIILNLWLEGTAQNFEFGGYGTPADETFRVFRNGLNWNQSPAWNNNRWHWWSDVLALRLQQSNCGAPQQEGAAWILSDLLSMHAALFPSSTGTRVTQSAPQIRPTQCREASNPFLSTSGGRNIQTYTDFNYGAIKTQYLEAMGRWPARRRGVQVEPRLWLAGPFSAPLGRMTAHELSTLPASQPFAEAPWNYTGPETRSGSASDVVDWVLVELRVTSSPGTLVDRGAGLLLTDGRVVGPDRQPLTMPGAADGAYFIVVRHRNHLDAMSSAPVLLSSQYPVSYDFRTGPDAVYGSAGTHSLGSSGFALSAGDTNGDGVIGLSDKFSDALPQNGSDGYIAADFDFDGLVTALDLVHWYDSWNLTSSVPND
ncbi:MAG: hypothetical protein AAGI08_13125 [Bacteroidota bacterium]